MAIFRSVNMSFWTDTKVVDDFTPEDKLFMVYALTNNYTNIIGCYEISIKQMSDGLGYNKDTIEKLIDRFMNIHKTIEYDFETKELYVRNWYKYNWNISPKLNKPLYDAIEKVKSDKFHDELTDTYNLRETVEEKIPYRYGIEKKGYPIDTTITITNTITNTNTISNSIKEENKEEKLINISEEVINRLNELTGSSFRASGKSTKELIKGLLNDYSKEDILTVVEKMCYLWSSHKKGEKDMSIYLRPLTLFRKSNFDNYYGMKVPEKEITTKDLDIDISDF